MPSMSKPRVRISAEFSWVSKVRESRKQARTIHEFTRTARKPSATLFFFRATSCELVARTRGSKQIGQSAKVAGDLKIRKLLMYGSGKRYEDLCEANDQLLVFLARFPVSSSETIQPAAKRRHLIA